MKKNEVEEDIKDIRDIVVGDTLPPEQIRLSTLQDKLLANIITGVYITNGLLFYLCGLWTIRLFQPLKVFQ